LLKNKFNISPQNKTARRNFTSGRKVVNVSVVFQVTMMVTGSRFEASKPAPQLAADNQ